MLMSKFSAYRKYKLSSLNYNVHRNWFKSRMRTYGESFYPQLDYYVDTFMERYEKFDMMGFYFRFLMRFKSQYKSRIDLGYFNLYCFAYLLQAIRQNTLLRRPLPLCKTISVEISFTMYQKQITSGGYWSGSRLKDPRDVKRNVENALYVR